MTEVLRCSSTLKKKKGVDDLFAEEIAVTAALLSALSLVPSGPIRPASNPRYNT